MINGTRFKPPYLAGLDIQLPLLLAGAAALTRFGRTSELQRQLASASDTTRRPYVFINFSAYPLTTFQNGHISHDIYSYEYSYVVHRI
jgi:hypothetical protein